MEEKITYNELRKEDILIKKYLHSLSLSREDHLIKKGSKNVQELPDDEIRFYNKYYETYRECDTLEKAGQELNVTPQIVRQILERGNKFGFFEYPTREDLITYDFLINYYKNKEEILEELSNCIKIDEALEILNTDIYNFTKLLNYFNLNLEDFKICLEKRKLKIQYDEYVGKVGHHPTTTEMSNDTRIKYVWNNITRLWSSIVDFRKEFEYSLVKQGKPKLEEWQRQRNVESVLREKSYMKVILKNLTVNGALSNKQLADKCDITENHCRNILNLMIKRGEVIKSNRGAKTAYMIKE